VNATPGYHRIEVIERTKGMRMVHTGFAPRQSELTQLMSRAVYTLCPRGDTTESSRIYQALAHGSIPLVEPNFHGPLHAGNWSEFTWPIKPAAAQLPQCRPSRACKRLRANASPHAQGLELPSAEQEVRLQARLAQASAAFDCKPGSDAMARFLRDAVARLDLSRPAAPVVPPHTHARLRLFEPCRKLFTQATCGVGDAAKPGYRSPQECMDCLQPVAGHLECRCVLNNSATLASWGKWGPSGMRDVVATPSGAGLVNVSVTHVRRL